MKAEELFYSLDHVGEDLIGAAEQNVLARRRRPWGRAAAAAVLAAAVGLGGFFLWRNLRTGGSPAVTGNEPTPDASTVTPEPVNENPRELPTLELGDCWTRAGRSRFEDLRASMAGSLVLEYDTLRSLSLPVYRRGNPAQLYTQDQLNRRIFRAAEWLGVTLSDQLTLSAPHAETAFTVSAQTDQGTLTVSSDGSILMQYNEDYVIHPTVKVDFSEPLDKAAEIRARQDAAMESCGQQLCQRLGLPEYEFVTRDRMDPFSSGWTVYTLYPRREDMAQQLSARYFSRIRLLTVDGLKLCGFSLDRFPGEDEVPEGLELVGSYPVRSADEATAAVLAGRYLCEEELDPAQLQDGQLLEENLVYLPEYGHRLLVPFYRFWILMEPAGSSSLDASAQYLPVYVPAVQDAYLTDWTAEPEESGAQQLTLGQIGGGEPLLLTDPDAYHDSNPWQELPQFAALPVYRNPLSGSIPLEMEQRLPQGVLPEEMLAGMLELTASSCGLSPEAEPEYLEPWPWGDESLYAAARAETELGLLTARSDGSVTLLFRPEAQYSPRPEAGFTGSDADESLIRAFCNHILDLAGLRRDLSWGIVSGLCPQALQPDGTEEALYPAFVFAKTNEAAAYSLSRITLWYRDGTLWGCTIPTPVIADPALHTTRYGEEAPAEQEGWSGNMPLPNGWTPEVLGRYPIISPTEARALARAGQWAGLATAAPSSWELTEEPAETQNTDELRMDLVYLPNETGESLLPFYRFLRPLGRETQSGALAFQPLYIPAVNQLFLSDYPNETAAAAPELQASGGAYGIPLLAGPAGSVEALSFMIAECHDPVWADPDADGQPELVYWCYGPTSGLFTVSICVYGLEQGWPVLEAAQLYNLNRGELRLTEEDREILLHYTPRRYDPEAGSTVSQAEESCAVTVQDGELLLNGGQLPEGCALWGGPEWTRFGRSFAWLREQPKERLIIDYPDCLIWQEAAQAQDVPKTFVALSGNGVTVTGLLRYEQPQDGHCFCFASGMEPLDPLGDISPLAALTPEELEARLGPCHFSLRDGSDRFWFTRDGKLLALTRSTEGQSLDLQPIAPVDN